MSSAQVIEQHRAAGRFFKVGEVQSFVREEGQGETVLCMHGVPASCFLYRKVLPALAQRGLKGVAFDLPGLGLADRPLDFDYTWTGLGRFAAGAVEALGLERYHLVVHDIGGPVGFELAAAHPDRVLSITVLNTIIEVDHFHRPWVMEPFAIPVLGPIWLASIIQPVFKKLMFIQGIKDRSAITDDELGAWVDLLKREDGGRAFLKIMKGFERTPEKAALYTSVLQGQKYPLQVIWGAHDPALTRAHYGAIAKKVTGVESVVDLPAMHFLQEDQAPQIAEHVAKLAGSSSPC